MGRTVSIGAQDFKALIENNYFYIDKTGLIEEWWDGGDVVTLIARPRRFGKTLNMSMLDYFFSNKYEGKGEIFEGLKIWEDEKFRKLQGTYPVISMTFSDIKERDIESVIEKLKLMISGIYNDNDYLLNGDVLNDFEKKTFRSICNGDVSTVLLKSSLQLLSKYLYEYYEKKVIILLDEYDTPLQEAYVDGYWDDMSSFIRGFFNATLKANTYLERAMLTGITRVSKESIFSDLNNLNVVTITSEKYCDKFGFTVNEMDDILAEYDRTDEAEEVRRWYDGFIFGENTTIYNPWSIINYIDNHKFQSYWANTSSNSLIGQLIRFGNEEIKELFTELMHGKSIKVAVDEEIVFSQLSDNPEAIWSLMLATGYLKIESIAEDGEYLLELTNHEVRITFKSMVSSWFKREKKTYNEFIKAMIAGDLKAMNAYMNRITLNMMSFFDSGKQPSAASEPERFYHGLTLGLIVDLEDKYFITSNRESGFGRYDVCMEPKSAEYPGIIIEFKVIDRPDDENLKAAAQSALAQIEEKQYEASLKAKGITDIKKYGFAFEGKEVLILAEPEVGA